MASANKLKINYCAPREFLSLCDALFDLAKFVVKRTNAIKMSYGQQQIGYSDPETTSGFSPVYTSFQQRGGERDRFSPMGNASPLRHMPYPVDNLGQPSTRCSPQCGYMSNPGDTQHPSYTGVASWSQAPSQLGVNMPEYHQAVQPNYPAPLLPGMKMEPDFNQPFQFQATVEVDCPRVPLTSTDYQAFDIRSETQDSYTQRQTESQKRSAQYLKQVALQGTEQELLPKYLYFSQFPMWAEFYRKFLKYARDKDWSSRECKKNMGYVLEGRVAEYFHTINEQEPNLPYYDLVIRLEDFVKELWSQGVVSPVNMGNNQNLTYNRMQFSPVPMYPGNPDFPPSPNITPGPQYSVLETCSQSNGYTPYNGSHNDNNLTIESLSIDTNIVSTFDNGCTLKSEREFDIGIASESKPNCQPRQRYVLYRGSKQPEPPEEVATGTSRADRKINHKEDQTSCTLNDRMAHLEEMFSRITELTDLHLSRQCKSEKRLSSLHDPHTPSFQDPPKFALQDSLVSSLHDPLTCVSALHDPPVTSLYERTTSLHGQRSAALHSPQTTLQGHIPTETCKEPRSPENGNRTLELRSETRGPQNSDEQRIQSLVEYADWLNGMCNRPVGASTPNDERIWVEPECEDWSDQELEGTDSGENSLLQLLFSKKCQIGPNTPISAVPAKSLLTTDGVSVNDNKIQEVSSVCTDTRESNSEEAEFWWDSLDTKNLLLEMRKTVWPIVKII